MDTDLLRQGLELMLVGMGTVFVFLTLLVLSTLGMSRLVMRWQPLAEVASGAAGPADSGAAVAAMTAAVIHHRARHPARHPAREGAAPAGHRSGRP